MFTAITVLAAVGLGATLAAQTALTRYGVTDANANDVTMSAVEGTYKLGSLAKSFLALSAAARATAVNDAIAWARNYLDSTAFAQAWASERDSTKPQPPATKGSLDDETKQEIADQLQQAAEMRKALETLPPDQRPQMETLIKEMEDRTKDAAKVRQDIANRRAEDQERYQADLDAWTKDHPADPKSLMAARLQDYLTTCADVDFDAKLETRDGLKVFADEQYEEKPAFWKMCYRAGREANTAARAAATAWLKQLGR